MQHSPGFLALVDDAMQRVREITVADVLAKRARGEVFALIDVREDREWEAGRAAEAVHMARGVIERDIELAFPDKDVELVLYCGGGFRSALSADNLQKMGYTCVLSMAGGWRAWTGAEAPVEGR